uniref:C-type lectin domain-containing protein n=1 Tax=Kryptolebias marmoratus TaxID=37003 RepID=A0A3Q3AIH8_KRYMA
MGYILRKLLARIRQNGPGIWLFGFAIEKYRQDFSRQTKTSLPEPKQLLFVNLAPLMLALASYLQFLISPRILCKQDALPPSLLKFCSGFWLWCHPKVDIGPHLTKAFNPPPPSGHCDLASVRNEAENQKVKELIPSTGINWIGLYRDTWKWSDGSSSSFRYWRGLEPNDNMEHCAAIYFQDSGRWEDWNCDKKNAFICQNGKAPLLSGCFS